KNNPSPELTPITRTHTYHPELKPRQPELDSGPTTTSNMDCGQAHNDEK
ncbi:hypothetical protein PL2TA16_02443, partial [Pseudoalteromonas luteoviolacea 2ta16]